MFVFNACKVNLQIFSPTHKLKPFSHKRSPALNVGNCSSALICKSETMCAEGIDVKLDGNIELFKRLYVIVGVEDVYAGILGCVPNVCRRSSVVCDKRRRYAVSEFFELIVEKIVKGASMTVEINYGIAEDLSVGGCINAVKLVNTFAIDKFTLG